MIEMNKICKNYIIWYEDDKIKIYFSTYPKILIRYPKKENSEIKNKEIEKFPFKNLEEIEVKLVDNLANNEYIFNIEKDYCWDGASIPSIFWNVIGSKENCKFLIASLIHDKLCQNHNLINYDRYFSSKVFERLLYCANIKPFKRWLMFHSVDNFQKFQNWKK